MEKLEKMEIEGERKVKERSNTGRRYGLFAEQFLEQPVYAGEATNLGISVTCCTFRGIPTIDDY